MKKRFCKTAFSMKASLKEVAERAGVSLTTVSQVLNGNAAARISPDTQAKVRHAADALRYRPNPLARSLGRRRSDTIGVLVGGFQNPFFVDVMEAAERGAEEAGYRILLDAPPSDRGTYREHRRIQGFPADGYLVWANADQSVERFLDIEAVVAPVVYMGYPRADGSDWVAFDLAAGMDALVRHVLAQGHRRLAYATVYALEKARREPRFATVCEALGDEPTVFTTGDERETRASGLALGGRIAALPALERPDAVLCHNDVLAVGLIAGLVRAGLRVPEDVSVAGFDGLEEGQYLPLPLTTVHTDPARLAAESLAILVDRMGPNSRPRPAHALVPPTLMVGGTVRPKKIPQ